MLRLRHRGKLWKEASYVTINPTQLTVDVVTL